MTLTTRQKVLLPLLLLTLVVLFWLLLPLLNSESKTNSHNNNTFKSRVKKGTQVNAGHLSQLTSPTLSTVASKPTIKTLIVDKAELSKRQKEYLDLANAYKISQMKRLIAEENQAIVVAKQRAAKAAVETQTLLGKANKQAGVEVTALDSHDKKQTYKLIYTGEQAGRWNATLKVQGRLQDVLKGTQLPNGAEVIKIDRDTVVIKEGDHKKIVSFYYTTDTLLKPVASKVVAAPSKVVMPKAKKIVKKTVAKPVKIAKHNPIQSTSVKITPKKVASKPQKVINPIQIAAKKPVVTKKPVMAKKPVVAKKPIVAKKPVIAQKPVVAKKPALRKTKAPSRHYTEAEKRLLKAPSQDYTIQLLANTRLSSIKQFVAKNKLVGKTTYYRTTINGLPMYVLIYDNFSSSDDAVETIATLPIELQRYTPFIKSLKAIQSELHRVG